MIFKDKIVRSGIFSLIAMLIMNVAAFGQGPATAANPGLLGPCTYLSDQVTVSGIDFNAVAPYLQTYAISDAAGNIVAFDPAGNFGAVPPGTYDLWAFNYDPTAAVPSDPTGLTTVADVMTLLGTADVCIEAAGPYSVDVCDVALFTDDSFCDTNATIAVVQAVPGTFNVNYTQEYYLVDATGAIVGGPSTNAQFTTPAIGNYTVYAVNYDPANPITVTNQADLDALTVAADCAEVASGPIEVISCAPMAGCTALAGEPILTPETVCLSDAGAFDLSTKFGAASGGYDDGAGNFDAVNVNYVAVDQATGEILGVATSAAMIDLSGAPVGTVACVYQLAYTQALLDDVTGFLDNLLCNTLCVPVVGPCLGDVGYCPGVTPAELAPFLDLLNQFFGFNETQICNFLDNQIITIPDPTGLIGDQSIDLAANGLDFCADKSNAPYCVTIEACVDIAVTDPCNCTSPNNVGPGATGLEGDFDFFYEEITITAPAGASDWVLDFGGVATYDAAGVAAPPMITDNMDGTYTIVAYFAAGDAYTLDASSVMAGVAAGSLIVNGGGCTPCVIPTLSEWGLMTLALLLMAFGSVTIAAKQVSLAGVGTRNIPLPTGSNFSLPFNAVIFRKAMYLTMFIALIGFAICFALYSEIFGSDLIGVTIAGPVFAYLIHLLYILEKNKK